MMFDAINRELFGPHGYAGEEWAMTFADKFALAGILQQRRPPVAIEVGTLKGGSLSVIAKYSGHVYSIDPDPQVPAQLGGRHANVTFITARSQEALPGLVDRLNREGAEVGFILIDGDHTEAGVRADIAAVLRYLPRAPLWLLMHDSFNPDCRRAIQSIDWAGNPHVQWINTDFIPGFLSSIAGWEDQMWCGFALALLGPDRRTGPLPSGELLGRQFAKLLPLSVHGA